MMISERECFKEALELVQKMKEEDIKKVENRINDSLKILESKGIYPLYLWIAYQNKEKETKLIFKELENFLEKFFQRLLFKKPVVEKENIIKMFEDEQDTLKFDDFIYTKITLEKILNYALYKARALAKNQKGGSIGE